MLNQYLKPILLLIAGFALCLIFFNQCESEPVKVEIPHQNKQIDNRAKELLSQIANRDSTIAKLKSLKPTIQIRIKTQYDTLYAQLPDSLKPELDSLNDSWMDLALINLQVIDSLQANCQDYKSVILKKDSIIHNDSTYTSYLLTDSIPAVYKKRFWKGYKKGFKHGAITGAVLDESIRAGARSFKP